MSPISSRIVLNRVGSTWLPSSDIVGPGSKRVTRILWGWTSLRRMFVNAPMACLVAA